MQKPKADPQVARPNAVRIIKKYPNRRLYDTDTSSYITLQEVKQLVMEGQPFVVRDAKNNEDLTRSIFLQIILEEEAAGAPMFSEAVLAQLIRFYGQTVQGLMGPWLEQQLKWLADWQSRGAAPEAWAQFMPPGMGAMQEQMQKNAEQMLGVWGLKR